MNTNNTYSSFLRLALPLILSALSNNLMLFIDRLMLSQKSVLLMNACASCGVISFNFIFSLMTLVQIVEVYVGKYYGENNQQKSSNYCFQMIVFSLLTMGLFMPISLFGQYLLPSELYDLGNVYFMIILNNGPIILINCVLGCFFAATGQTTLLLLSVLLSNLLNIILDYIFIFGIYDFGIIGAGLGTSISQIMQLILLASVFYINNKKHLRYSVRLKTIVKMLTLSSPLALAHFIENSAHSIYLHIVASISIHHITALTIGQNIFMMLSFFSDGFQKTIIAKTTNYIGMGAKHKIHELFKVSIKIYLCFVLLLATIFILFGNSLFNFFNTSDLELLNNSYYDKILLLFFTWSFLVADGLIHTLGGFLISFRYTNYVMIINSICCWLLGVLPIYLLAYKAPKPWTIFAIFTIYSMIIAIIFWRKIKAPEKQFMAAAIISH